MANENKNQDELNANDHPGEDNGNLNGKMANNENSGKKKQI